MTESPLTTALDLRELLVTLDRHAVEYLVIGGVAVQVHGHRRTTKDLDIIAAPDAANIARLHTALEALGARPRDIPGAQSPTIEQLTATAIVPPLITRHGELHILRDVPGASPYADLRARALVVALDAMAIAIVELDDLIAMKRASGRPSDLRDIAVLTTIGER